MMGPKEEWQIGYDNWKLATPPEYEEYDWEVCEAEYLEDCDAKYDMWADK